MTGVDERDIVERLERLANATILGPEGFRLDASTHLTDAEWIVQTRDAMRAAAERLRRETPDRHTRVIEGWAQWVDADNWLFEVTNDPSAAQDPATLTIRAENIGIRCRGSFALGTACGNCQRCDEERAAARLSTERAPEPIAGLEVPDHCFFVGADKFDTIAREILDSPDALAEGAVLVSRLVPESDTHIEDYGTIRDNTEGGDPTEQATGPQGLEPTEAGESAEGVSQGLCSGEDSRKAGSPEPRYTRSEMADLLTASGSEMGEHGFHFGFVASWLRRTPHQEEGQ